MAYLFKHYPQGSNIGTGTIQFRHYGEEIPTYTVTFVANNTTVSKAYIVKGEKPTAEDIPDNPTRNEWIFQGWYIDENTKFNNTDTVVTKDMTVTAKWSQTTQTGTESRKCEDCGGTGTAERYCPLCTGSGTIMNSCNACGTNLGDDWDVNLTPNCPKCNADLSTPNAVEPDVKCSQCEGTGNIHEACTCDDGQRDYPVYETVTELY